MDWTQVWTVIGITSGLFLASIAATISLFIWNRSESRTDNRRILDLLEAINKEMKDFHGRLCAIEEKNKK